MLAAADLPAGCTRRHREDGADRSRSTRASQVADLVRMKDPADAAYGCAPARFVRATRAVAPPAGMMGMREAIGETEFEQQQILGYAPIEPDGSFKLHRAGRHAARRWSVIDAKGRGIQTHLNWIQVRPGERRTCDGCHSPRRGARDQLRRRRQHDAGGAHADARRARTSRARRWRRCARASTRPRSSLIADLVFSDVWADTTKPGVTARPSITIKYTGNANPADDLRHRGADQRHHQLPEHIAPLWTRDRGANTCTDCHTDPAKLDLRADDRRHRPRRRRTRSCCSATR